MKGYIHRTQIQGYSDSSWKSQIHNRNPTGKNRAFSPKPSSEESSVTTEALTPQEEQYVESHEHEMERDRLVEELILRWTNKTIAERGGIIAKTSKGADWRKSLADESAEYMLSLAKQMTDSAVSGTLNDLRILRYLADRFSDILYVELELRKKKQELNSV